MSRNGILIGLIVVVSVATVARSPLLNPDSLCNAYNRLVGFEICAHSTANSGRANVVLRVGADSEIAKAAIFSLAGSLTEDDVADLVVFTEAHNDRDVRKAAIFAIADVGGEESFAILREIVHDPSTEIAIIAIHALANQIDQSEIAELESLIREVDESDLKKTLVYQVADTGGNKAAAILSRVIETESNSGVRKAAVYALGQLETAEARSVLARLANHGG